MILNCHMKIKKPEVHFIIKKKFLIENECKTPTACLKFIFYYKYFYDKMNLKIFILMWRNGVKYKMNSLF